MYTVTYEFCEEDEDATIVQTIAPNTIDTGGGGGGGGGTGNPIPVIPGNPVIPNPTDPDQNPGDTVVTEPILPMPTLREFQRTLTPEEKAWWDDPENNTQVLRITNYLNENYNTEGWTFAKQLIAGITALDFESELEKLEVTNVLIYAQTNNYFNQNIDSDFCTGIAPYSTRDFTDPTYALKFARLFLAHCAIIKQENPTWSNVKIFGQAYLDTVHFLLDFAGLVPAIGEVADLANGTIYLIEGDGVNATLSYASAIPVAGWFSAGVKMAKRADGLRFLVVGANNLINFGAANSKKFRVACGIAVGDATKQAHHIIPRGSQIIEHTVVQRAAKATTNEGFHIDEALNGIAVATWRNQPNHNQYNNKIYDKLDDYLSENPNATPTQCYNKLMEIINQARAAILNNPNVHLNNLNF